MVSLFFDFNGRINRLQYWTGNLALLGLGMLVFAGLFVEVIANYPKSTSLESLGNAVLLALAPLAVMVWCSLALQVKRLHDRGRSGYLALLQFAPLINIPAAIFFLIDLGFLPGKPGANEHGDPPGTRRAPTPTSGASSLANAELAMQRAIAAHAATPFPTATEPQRQQIGAPTSAARGFGQRPARA